MAKTAFLMGMVAGTVVGATVTVMADPKNDRRRRNMKKKTSSVFRTVGNILDDVTHSRMW